MRGKDTEGGWFPSREAAEQATVEVPDGFWDGLSMDELLLISGTPPALWETMPAEQLLRLARGERCRVIAS